jgi:hypothetical protein
MKSPSTKLLAFVTIGLIAVAAGAVGGDFFLRDGDRVVFLGDGITEQHFCTTYIAAHTLTRYPIYSSRPQPQSSRSKSI